MPDPAATSQFFTNLFGLESQNGVLVDKSEMSFAKLHATTSDKKSRTGRGTIDHIAYTLETKEAVDELHDLAVRNDLKIEEFVDREYFKSLYIREPGGLRIEFAVLAPVYYRRTARNNGRKTSLTKLFRRKKNRN